MAVTTPSITPAPTPEHGSRGKTASRPMLLLVVIAIGMGAGVSAFALKWMVAKVSIWVLDPVTSEHKTWPLLVLPFLALSVTALLCRYVFREQLANGVKQVKNMLAAKKYYLGPSRVIYTLLASTVTLGLGGSAGSEGPMVYAGAAIANSMGRWLRLSQQQITLLIACGAGAGIAAIFKSPIGGALFSIEILHVGLSAYGAVLLFTCSITAGLTSYMLGGCHFDLSISGIGAFEYGLLPVVLLLGFFCGVYSLYYGYMIKFTEKWLMKIRQGWLRVATAGLLIALLIATFPALYGEGYKVAASLASGNNASLAYEGIFPIRESVGTIVGTALLILLVKSMATSLTNNGGGVSGDFAPTIFAGAVGGYIFAFVGNTLLGCDIPVDQMVLYGMGAVMAGAIRAPLMSIVIVVEMTGATNHFVPIALVSAISYFTVRAFTRDSYYSDAYCRVNGYLFKKG